MCVLLLQDAESSYLRKFEAEVARDFGKEDAVSFLLYMHMLFE